MRVQRNLTSLLRLFPYTHVFKKKESCNAKEGESMVETMTRAADET